MSSPSLFRPMVLAAQVALLITLTAAESTVILGPAGTCPILPEATVEAQPVVYSQYFESNTAIAPFNNGFTYEITNAPTSFSISTTVYITNYPGEASSQSFNYAAPTTTAASTTQLRLGEGLPSGTVSNLPGDMPFVLGWVGLNLPSKRESQLDVLEDEDHGVLRRAPVQAISNIQGAAAAAQTAGAGNWISGDSAAPVSCNSATAYRLTSGQLLRGNTPVGKYQGDTTVAFGAALNGNANPIINVGFSLINGLLAWNPPDVGVGVFYSCGGVVYTVFDPTSNDGLVVAPYSNCSLVAIGGLSSTTCAASLNLLPVPSLTIPSITIPSSYSINPTGFLSVPSPRISSIGVGGIVSGILGGLSSLSIPSQPPSISINTIPPSISSISVNTAISSLSSVNLAALTSSINLGALTSSINLGALTSSINLAALTSTSINPAALTSNINLAAFTSSINLAALTSTSLYLAPPSLTVPSTIDLSPPSIALSSITISSFSVQTPVLSLPSTIIPSALPSLSLSSFSTTLPLSLQSSIVLNVSPPSRSPISLAPPSVPVITIPTPLSVATPQISLPTDSLQRVSTPGAGSLTLPSFSPFSTSLPSESLPSFSLPTGTLQSVSLPSPGSTLLPSVSFPTVGNISLPSLSGSLPGVSLSTISISDSSATVTATS